MSGHASQELLLGTTNVPYREEIVEDEEEKVARKLTDCMLS
jgi:hypothetical protein